MKQTEVSEGKEKRWRRPDGGREVNEMKQVFKRKGGKTSVEGGRQEIQRSVGLMLDDG